MARSFGSRAVAALAVLGAFAAGCAKPDTTDTKGPVGSMVDAAATRHGVPTDLMLAIGEIEGGLRLRPQRSVDADDNVPVAGVLELRHGAYNSLARGATLMGVDESTLESDLARGTEAGAMVLADLAHEASIEETNLSAWAPVVETLSGYRDPADRAEYRSRVFTLLKYGGALKARDGETITLSAHDEVPSALTLAPPEAHVLGAPDYAPAIYFPTSCTNKCDTTRGGVTISMIAIHDTEGGWDASVATLQNDPGKSVHYIVDADGSRVGQFVPESYTAWHVGNYYYNQRMVGIEHVGYAAQDAYQTPMYVASSKLVKDIGMRNSIPLDRAHIIGHQEVPDGNLIPESSPPCTASPASCTTSPNYGGAANHRDPGVHWNWCQYLELVGGGSCKCNDASNLFNCSLDGTLMVRCQNGTIDIQQCPYGCVTEPNGTNDKCADPPATTASSTSTGISSTTSSAVSSSASVTPIQSTSAGAGGAGGASGLGGNGTHGGCSCSTVGGDDTSVGYLGVGIAAAAVSLRRWRRRRHARAMA